MTAAHELTQGFVPGPRGNLLVCLHQQSRPAPVFLISAALGVTFTEPRYLMTLLARRAAEVGYTVVQYDHPAEADSIGMPGDASAADLLEAGERMAHLARSVGDGRVAAAGYGVGNVVVAHLLSSGKVDQMALIGPCLRAWAHPDWQELCPPGDDGLIAPPVTADRTRAGDVWRAVYGEPIVPSQPPGPMHPRLLHDLAVMSPATALREQTVSTLIVSDLPEDLPEHAQHRLLLHHAPTAEQPSWHWNMSCREQMMGSIVDWLGSNAAKNPRTAAEQSGKTIALPTRTDGMDQEVIRVQAADEEMFGILRSAHAAHGGNQTCVIYETGNPGQRVDIHRCAPVAAERLAAHGIASFRYDPRGMGSSNGAYHEMTWSRREEDLRAVINTLVARGFTSFVLLGNSAGARTALTVAKTDLRVSGLALWGPILSESEASPAAPSLVRVPGGVATEWCGLPLGLAYQRDVRRLDYVTLLRENRTPTCIVFAEDEPDQDNQQAVLDAVRDRWEVEVYRAPGAHGFNWHGLGRAIDLTVAWIDGLKTSTRTPQ
ncbi:serine aminopeptidase domain-containing protein [Streptomyces sp. NPDC001073]